MVVDELDLVGMAVDPLETDAPLIVHANAVLSGAIAAELFQLIATRDTEVGQPQRGVDVSQLAQHHAAKVRRVVPYRLTTPQALGIAIGEAPDHSR